MRLISTVFICLIPGLLCSFAGGDSLSCKYSRERHEIDLQGGCIAPPAPNENIRLDAMRVTIRAKRYSYSVDAVYHLFNTGKTSTETVGVPKFGRLGDAPDCDTPPTICDFLGFDAWVNGRRTEFAEVSHFFTDPGARPIGGYCEQFGPTCIPPAKTSETRWMTKAVTFPGKALSTIRVRYEALYHQYVWDSGWWIASGYYHWSTGRYWKGKIKKATVIFDMTDIAGTHCRVSFPQGAIWASEVREFEPSPGYHVCIPGCHPY